MYKTPAILFFLNFFPMGFAQKSSLELDLDEAKKLAGLPLHCIDVEYPNKLNQVLTDDTFLNSPKKLHPIFYGCFDWHSSVHGHWLLASITSKFPETDLSEEIKVLFDRQFTKENVDEELRYFQPKLEKSFERTYGWAWLLKLQAELIQSPFDKEHNWSQNLKPLIDFVVQSYKEFLPKLVYPIRVGEHNNTAFGLSLALDYARTIGDVEFESLIIQRAKDYFLNDKNCPLTWEPSGFDFISPCLQEAELMSKVLVSADFEKWMKDFLPQIFKKNFKLEPGKVIDRTDGKLVHLDGLNFSRACCFYSLADALSKHKDHFLALGDLHVKESISQVVNSDYMGSHWLASFLMLALDSREKITK